MEEREANTFIRNYGKYIIIFFLFMIVGYVLLYLTYNKVKQEMIEGLNSRQMIHAKQAAKGIETFFNGYTEMLRTMSNNEHIVSLSTTGKMMMREGQLSHKEDVSIIARMDSRGRILHAEPYNRRVIGQPVTKMDIFQKVKSTHQVIMSNVFTNRRGFKSIIVHAPVFKRGSFDGTLALIFTFDVIARHYIEDIRIGQDGYAWVIGSDGIEISCPIPGHVGNSVFDNCREFPDILAMAQKMTRGESGVTTYMFNQIRGKTISKTIKHAIFMPIHLGENFWSIAVATPEDEVLNTLRGFRDRLLLIAVLFLLCIASFVYLLFKASIVLKEVELRRKTDDALRHSEERYRLIAENTADIISVMDMNRS
jgi:PAS domain-containing protein